MKSYLSFTDALNKNLIPFPNKSIELNKFTRWGQNNCYWAKQITPNIIVFGDFSQGITETWFGSNGNCAPNSLDNIECKKILQKTREAAELQQQQYHQIIAAEANEIWKGASTSKVEEHPYLTRKGIKAFGIKLNGQQLLIPIHDEYEKIWSYQTIDNNGNKRYMRGGRKKGNFFLIGSLQSAQKIYMCEGYATGASIHIATAKATIVAFDIGNLEEVTAIISKAFPKVVIVICADNDQWGEKNIGKEKAEEVAKKYNCQVALPYFAPDILPISSAALSKPTDFNDLHNMQGVEEVKRQLDKSYAVKETLEETIKRLKRLSKIEFEQVRSNEAKKLGIRVSVLDQLISEPHPSDSTTCFQEDEIWPHPINLEQILNELSDLYKRYVILPTSAETVLSLWTVFTWCINYVNTAPILAIYSPEKQCGKTTLLEVIGKVVCRPVMSSNISASAIFRLIEKQSPTLIIDEADSFLKENEALRNILNSGHKRANAYSIRVEGEEREPRKFSTWGAKTIALIGQLPDTLHDRSIVIELKRRRKDEKVEKLRRADPEIFGRLRSQIKRCVTDYAGQFKNIDVLMPEDIADRAADNWEPLMIIATIAGPTWMDKAFQALNILSPRIKDAVSIGTALLQDIKQIFESKGQTRISSKDLIKNLCEDPERPWLTYNKGHPISVHQISQMLKQYKIHSKTLKLPDNQCLKGYELKDFKEAFTTYTSEKPIAPLQPALQNDLLTSNVIELTCVLPSNIPGLKADLVIGNDVTDKSYVEVQI